MSPAAELPKVPAGLEGELVAAAVSIGQAAAETGVSAKMIRHYESLGLLPQVPRTDGGYRQYDERALHALRFIRRARDLGFGLDEIEHLLALWADDGRASASVKALAARQIADLQARIERMQAMQRTLRHLVHACHGDQRPDCPILDDLAGGPAPITSSGAAPRDRSTAPQANRSPSRRLTRGR